MNKTEAKAAVEQIHAAAVTAGELLLEFREREGWKALGYESFKQCCEKEFAEIYGNRSNVYRLITQAEVTENVSHVRDSGLPVPMRQAKALAALSPDKQAEVVKQVASENAGALPEAAVAKAVASAKPPAKAASSASSAPARSSDKREAALERIESICGKPVRKAIENGTLKVSGPELVTWAAQKDYMMAKVQVLVVEQRLSVTRALAYLNKMPGEKTQIAELHMLAAANDGATLVTTGAFATICYNWRRRPDDHARIKKLLGLER